MNVHIQALRKAEARVDRLRAELETAEAQVAQAWKKVRDQVQTERLGDPGSGRFKMTLGDRVVRTKPHSRRYDKGRYDVVEKGNTIARWMTLNEIREALVSGTI